MAAARSIRAAEEPCSKQSKVRAVECAQSDAKWANANAAGVTPNGEGDNEWEMQDPWGGVEMQDPWDGDFWILWDMWMCF